VIESLYTALALVANEEVRRHFLGESFELDAAARDAQAGGDHHSVSAFASS